MKNKLPKKPKILLIRPDAIGDVVLMIPLINTLKATFPNAEIYALLQEYTKDVFDLHPSNTTVIVDWKRSGKAEGLAGFRDYVSYIKSFKFDIVIMPFFEFYYAWLAFCARIPVRIGDTNRISLRPYINYGVALRFRNLPKHETEQNIDLAKGLLNAYPQLKKQGITIDTRTDLYVSLENENAIKEILERSGWNNELLIGIHTSTGGGNRPWLPKGYAELIDLIHEKTSYKVVLTGASQKEKETVQKIISLCKFPPLNLAGQTTIPLLKALIHQCSVFVGADTGPTHIAAALKVPVLCISPTKYVKSLRWGPWQTRNRVVGHPEVCSFICIPYQCQRSNCLSAVKADEVFDALMTLIKGPPSELTDKEQWLCASINVGLVCLDNHPKSIETMRHFKQLLASADMTTYSICLNKVCSLKLASALNTGAKGSLAPDFTGTGIFKYKDLIHYITHHDINMLHLISNDKKYQGKRFIIRNLILKLKKLVRKVTWFLIRQISALKIYCPPPIVEITDTTLSKKELLQSYLGAFH
ncbi:glycosyltransferase family 9 protein [Thermoproteota archaeon]